jgi:hypothetical protein
MSLGRIRPRHVYVSALAAFVALVGFESVRMAAGHDPALAATAAATPAPAPAAEPPTDDPQGFAGGDPGTDPQESMPQPESRLS